MSTCAESWDRLRAAKWISNPSIAKRTDPSCDFQTFAEGTGPFNYDEYSIMITTIPTYKSIEQFVMDFAKDPNGTVGSGVFSTINRFSKRSQTDPRIGDIYDIAIMGGDNGSIVVVEVSSPFGTVCGSMWFDINTVRCKTTGDHPECGAREFGIEYVAGGIKFYTRGVSRSRYLAARIGGPLPQREGWTAMMDGIGTAVENWGGAVKKGSFNAIKVSKSV